ncbi:zinc ribbon domain-containing protein [Ktedonosporobacter rubrisoli]|uniref:Zinc ribbon domain-containing protein n=1 Tax=Ktedonosporobacter rubrisoli TaxID=2509675 RepID=A0A4P6K1I5_KTERU|nr:zinc ribbon domain-containing protein [Ktedonosporobacter rubrisoli]
MNCSRCGTELPESATFCPRCGEAYEAGQPGTFTYLPAGVPPGLRVCHRIFFMPLNLPHLVNPRVWLELKGKRVQRVPGLRSYRLLPLSY